MENNIDEDIKILEAKVKEEAYLFKGKNFTSDIWRQRAKEHQAISNLLSELETYKKIAEKLAEQLEKDYTNCKCCKNLIRHFDMLECKEFANKKQCIIDWARKEVEK